MKTRTRRTFIRSAGLTTAAISLAGSQAPGGQMPGRPSVADEANELPPSAVMAIAAHPGDAFFAMGLAVALQVRQGARGVLLSLSLGEKGSAAIPPAQYGSLQREASQRAAQMIGAKAVLLAYPDGEVPVSDQAKFAVCDLIREYKPAVVITHWRGSWHKDHRACYKIVRDAIFYSGLPAIARAHPPHSVSKLFFAENWEDANGFTPDAYVDASPIFERWFEACAAFPMWRGETGFRYNDYYRSVAAARGCLSGSKYAVALMSSPEQSVRRLRGL